MKRTLTTIFVCFLLAKPAWAGYDEGVAAAKLGDYVTALRKWRPLAERGDPHAQYSLGLMYYWGRGVPAYVTNAQNWHAK